MIITSGIWNLVKLDGFECGLGQTYKREANLVVMGPERKEGDPWSSYSPFSPPKEDDNSPFALFYRKLMEVAKKIELEGPFGENHPAVYRRFAFMHKLPPHQLLEKLSEHGFTIELSTMGHKGEDAEVEAAKQDFARWITPNTVFTPNPKVVEAERYKQELAEHHARMAIAHKEDKRRKRRLWSFSLIAALILAGLGWWKVAVIATLFPIILQIGYVFLEILRSLKRTFIG